MYRILWRFLNLTSRECLWFLIWRIIGGNILIIILSWKCLYYLAIYHLTKQNIIFEAIMGYVCENIDIKSTNKEISDYMNEDHVQFSFAYFFVTCFLYYVFISVMFGLHIFN